MAIQVTELKAKSSIAADRITINDNFNIIVDATNNLLGIMDTTTGKIDNTGVGSDSVIVTEGLTITENGIDITQGDVGLDLGNIILQADSAYIQIGSANSQISETILDNSTTGTVSALDFSTFNLGKMPSLTTIQIAAIDTIGLVGGEFVYDSDVNKLKYFNATVWIELA